MSAHFDSNIMFRRENHIKNSVFYFDPKIYNFARKLTKKIVLLYFKCEILIKNPLFVLLCFQKSKNGKYMYFVLDQKQHIAQRHVFCPWNQFTKSCTCVNNVCSILNNLFMEFHKIWSRTVGSEHVSMCSGQN